MSIDDQLKAAYVDAREDVYRYLIVFGMDSGTAQDTTQEVFVRMYIALRAGEAIANPRGWAFRTAHNLGVDRGRKTHELQLVSGDRIATSGPKPDEQAIANQQLSRLRTAMSDLSQQQRQCLYLRAEGLKYREIADTMGIGVSSVSVFLGRALTKLRKVIHG